MKTLRNIIFATAMVIGLALSVSAQKEDQKRPPKQDSPKIVPREKPKPPRENRPKDDKKPGTAYFVPGTGVVEIV